MEEKTIKQIIREEYIKCAKSASYFMRKYCMIQHPTKGKIPFQLYPYQEDTLQDFQDNDRMIILKSRQLGISTLIAGYALWMILFQNDKNCLVVAIDQLTSKNLVTKVKVMYDNLPSWLKIKAVESNKLSIRLTNGSQIKAVSSTGTSGRSEALSLVIIDEAAFVDGAEELWASLQQTLSTGGQGILLSCVTKDTIVFTDKGLTEVSEFVDKYKSGGYQIQDYKVLGKDKLRQGNLFKNNGKVHTRKIKTKYAELEGSFNHKLWACKDGVYDWYELQQLNKGDYIAIQSGMHCWGNNDSLIDFQPTTSKKLKYNYNFSEISEPLAYLFGLYIAEGSAYKVLNKNNELIGGSITITCGDDVSKVFDDLNIPYYCGDGLRYTISSKYIIELFEHVGFNLQNKAHEKVIPLRLLKMSERNIKQLLRGLFDGDGYAYNNKHIIRVGLTTSSEKLANQVRVLLSNYGILAEKHEMTIDQLNKNNKFVYKFNYPSFRVEINGINAELYQQHISFNFKRKSSILESIKASDRANTKNTCPSAIKIYNDIQDCTGLTTKQISNILGYSANPYLNKRTKYRTANISKQRLLQAYNAFKHVLDTNYWDKIIDENLTWVPITSIEDSEAETYDFSLPHNENDFWCHSIIYNSILGHQTPNGTGNFFHKMWTKAEAGENKFKTVRLPWQVHPERTQAWRDRQDAELGPRLAAQECDCLWGSSIITLLDMETNKEFKISLEDLYWNLQEGDYL